MTGAPREPAAFPATFADLAPCGLLVLDPGGTVLHVNATLLGWVGRDRDAVEHRVRFADLLSVGGRIYYETHVAPLLMGRGRAEGIAAELRAAGGRRRPVLITAVTDVDDPAGEVRVVVYDAGPRRAYEDELLRARHEAEQERAVSQTLAATLQQTLLPPALPAVPGLAAAAAYHSASPDQVGGDFYDLFPLVGSRWGLFLGDVCGKGADAAVLTSLARYTLRAAAAHDPDPVSGLRSLHSVLMQNAGDGALRRFCTVLNATLSRTADRTFALDLASGGHPAPVLVRADGATGLVDVDHGQPVGLIRDPSFGRTTVLLHPGDTMLLYTDGLTEARLPPDAAAVADTGPVPYASRHGRMDEDGLLELVTSLGPVAPEALVQAVTTFLVSLGEGLEDDVAILALGVPA